MVQSNFNRLGTGNNLNPFLPCISIDVVHPFLEQFSQSVVPQGRARTRSASMRWSRRPHSGRYRALTYGQAAGPPSGEGAASKFAPHCVEVWTFALACPISHLRSSGHFRAFQGVIFKQPPLQTSQESRKNHAMYHFCTTTVILVQYAAHARFCAIHQSTCEESGQSLDNAL